ncbi:MAG: nucleoside monophosphate kinase [Candidatus Pacearchaeota archaeon]|nr:nucleoside monophosphate kinase [Candidatus Pacearchaeota archaeon]
MRLGIIGIQGSGKGTQAKLIAKKYKLKRVSVGDLLRKEVGKKSRIGKFLMKYIRKGFLAPNKLVDKLVLKNTPKNNFIIDGFPRDEKQLKTADKINLDKVILLTLPKKEVIKRIKKRKRIEHRKDDNDKSLEKRLEIFHKHSPLIVKHFKDKIIKVDGNQTIKQVFYDIEKALKNNSKK